MNRIDSTKIDCAASSGLRTRCAALGLAFSLAGVGCLLADDVVPEADSWHVTAYVFEADADPAGFYDEPITGTATLTAKTPGSVYTLTFDVGDESDSFDLTLQDGLLVGQENEYVGAGFYDRWRFVLRVVDENTIVFSDFWATHYNDDELVYFDCAGGVLTREPLPASSSEWTGSYQEVASVGGGAETGTPGIASGAEDEVGQVSIVTEGGGSFRAVFGEDDEMPLSLSAGKLVFSEVDTDPYVLYEDSAWRFQNVLAADKAFILQLGDGRLLAINGGAEITRAIAIGGDLDWNYLNWADLYVGVWEKEPELPAGYASWAASLGLEGSQALPDARPFPDGLPNLVRFAMNLGAAPAPEDIPKPAISLVDGEPHLVMDFRVRKGMADLTLGVETSLTLGAENWGNVPASNITRLPDPDAETERHRVALPVSGTKARFLRFKAETAE